MENFKENLANFGIEKKELGFKAKIKFDNKFFYVLDNFIYDNIKYYYIVEDKVEEIEAAGGIENYQGKIQMEYIYEDEPGVYQTVTSVELLKQLDIVQSARALAGEV